MINNEFDLKVICCCKAQMRLDDVALDHGRLWFKFFCDYCRNTESILFEDLCSAINEKGFYQAP